MAWPRTDFHGAFYPIGDEDARQDADLTALTARVTTAEGEIDTLQSDVVSLDGRVTALEP